MSRGICIVVTVPPRGVEIEGIISGTPVPGSLMEMTNAAPVGGRHTWQACQRADGVKGVIAILKEDDIQGFAGVGAATAFGPGAPGTAYVSGTRGRIYFPCAGEELNLPVKDVVGTGDSVAVADKFGVDGTNHGYIKANSNFGAIPFQSQEAITGPTADYMLWVRFLGDQA